MDSFKERRERLVDELVNEGILREGGVIRAMLAVPREEFVPPELVESAYVDSPLPSKGGQTISAPHMVAIMCQLLKLSPGQRMMEVGAGTGYHAAVCAEIVAPLAMPESQRGHVYALELVEPLIGFARANLDRCGYSGRVTILQGDGTLGLPQEAPFDRVLVTAAAPSVPPPLKMQLRDGGRIVIPVGEAYSVQELLVVERRGDTYAESVYGNCVFVPLLGQYGWSPSRL
jgi:protein-L-isoaspartate(D-aspartate) O-methyltransferase